jgi:hypothetical protein
LKKYVLPAVIAVALLAQYRGGPALGLDLASFASLASMIAAAASIRIASRALAFVSGVLALAIAWKAPALACTTAIFAFWIQAQRAMWIEALCAAVGLVALKSLPDVHALGIAFTVLKALVVVVLLEKRPLPVRPLSMGLLVFAGAMVVLRLASVMATAGNDGAVFWAEEPFLVDMLKLDAHQPLYGPIDQLGSYTYSPLMQLAHHALLAPFHAELSLFPNRVLTLLDQLAATILLSWAIAPRIKLDRITSVRPDLFVIALVFLVGFSSLLAGALHPDHPTFMCVALAFALVTREGSFPRWLWWTLLVLVTPLAVMFKLTGGGIGLGLAAVFLLERKWKPLAALAASGVLSALTVPLFDATTGSFSDYAIRLQKSHPLEWTRLVHTPTVQFAAAAAFALAIAASFREPGDRFLRTTCVYFACVAAAFFPAYVKYAGRENNLVCLLVASVIVLVLTARPIVSATCALYIVLLVWPPPSSSPPSPLGLQEQLDAAETAMKDDDAHHARTWASATLHIRHGGREPPKDCINIAYELFYGNRPEAELFFQHVSDGRYRSIIMVSSDLQPDETLRGGFALRLAGRLVKNYELVYPTVAVPANVNHIVIFRKITR